MNILDLQVREDENVEYKTVNKDPSDDTIQQFVVPLQRYVLDKINKETDVYPHIDFDLTRVFMCQLIDSLDKTIIDNIKAIGINGKAVSTSEWSKNREHKALMVFLQFYPEYGNLFTNVHLLASIAIECVEKHLGEEINTKNFVKAKQFIDLINRQRWTRPQDDSEKQSGVSNLGQVSELLLEKALSELIDQRNFFKTNNQKIQSYGDFVLMCLPNNLWLSVKSNFARERLLASGYTTDILGVGFFTSSSEFTSPSKIRNFQRVGFLAMYLPEIPISEKQISNDSNTYDEVVEYYGGEENLPVNINGTKFIRSLSQLHGDLERLLLQGNIANRIASDF
ncbi:hypothetical protein [Glaciecola sp. KUL10]|uniref:hypothetical protein n=1 Tax=Glaciecola sp. (strain KUL10) TaxID=2161813 RepID=UPI000D782A06|nr:hypothetical protein [Glaciecola sp. KUL10]GBL04543.1 hypothetical protein KUL10_18500 [Glaciecola sp. KUL10]